MSKKLRHSKSKVSSNYKTAEEVKLEQQLFGDDDEAAGLEDLFFLDDGPTRRPAQHELENPKMKMTAGTKGQKDKKASGIKEESYEDGLDLKGESDSEYEGMKEEAEDASRPAWEDDDDEQQELDLKKRSSLRWVREDISEAKVVGASNLEKRLRKRLEILSSTPTWAEIKEDNSGESSVQNLTSTILSSTDVLGSRNHGHNRAPALRKGKLRYSRIPDLNRKGRSIADITSARFHPQGELFMTAGLDKTVRVFQVDGKENPKLQSIVLDDLPIHGAEFIGKDGTEVLLTGPRSYAYTMDLVKGAVSRIPVIPGRSERQLSKFVVSPDKSIIAVIGSDGYILLLHGTTKQLIGTLRGPLAVASICFTPDGQRLISFTHNAQIHLWDIGTRKCIAQHIDNGSIHGTVVSTSPDGSYYATGNDSGVVNLYSSKSLEEAITFGRGRDVNSSDDMYTAKPMKEILSLKTCIDGLRFSPSNEILASSSSFVPNGVRLTHLPSMTSFSNFPLQKATLGSVSSMDFSPHSGLFAVGTRSGTVQTFRLSHYQTI